MNPVIIEQPQLRAACVRHIGAYMQIGQAFGRLAQSLSAAGLELNSPLIGIYHDDPASTPESQLRSDAGVLLAVSAPVPPHLTEAVLAPGRHAHLRHVGPYHNLGTSWARIKEWLPTQPFVRRAGPSYEIYRNTPMETAPAELITDIFVPIDLR